MDKAYFIPALIGAGLAAYQMIQAAKQRKEAKNMKPSNYVPAAVREAEVSARMNANAQSPAAARGLERIRQSTANTISSAKRVGGSAASVQQAVNDADAREKESLKDLQVADSQNQADNRQRLQDILMAKGNYQQQSQDAYNSAKSALIGAAQQNQYNAVTNLGEGIINSLPENAISPAPAAAAVASTPKPAASGALQVGKLGISSPKGRKLTPDQLQYLQQRYGQMRRFKTGYTG